MKLVKGKLGLNDTNIFLQDAENTGSFFIVIRRVDQSIKLLPQPPCDVRPQRSIE